MNMARQLSVNRVAAVIYDALREEVLAANGRRSNKARKGCLPQMDIIWECRSTEEHDVFRRVAEKVLAEVTKVRPEVARKLRVVRDEK